MAFISSKGLSQMDPHVFSMEGGGSGMHNSTLQLFTSLAGSIEATILLFWLKTMFPSLPRKLPPYFGCPLFSSCGWGWLVPHYPFTSLGWIHSVCLNWFLKYLRFIHIPYFPRPKRFPCDSQIESLLTNEFRQSFRPPAPQYMSTL